MRTITPIVILILFGAFAEAESPSATKTYYFRLAADEIPEDLIVGAIGELLYGEKTPQVIATSVKVTCIRPYRGEHSASCAPTRGMRADRETQICVEVSTADFNRISDLRGFCTFRKR